MVNKSIEEFTYTNKEIADELYKAMNATQFLGVSVWELSSLLFFFSFTSYEYIMIHACADYRDKLGVGIIRLSLLILAISKTQRRGQPGSSECFLRFTVQHKSHYHQD